MRQRDGNEIHPIGSLAAEGLVGGGSSARKFVVSSGIVSLLAFVRGLRDNDRGSNRAKRIHRRCQKRHIEPSGLYNMKHRTSDNRMAHTRNRSETGL